MIIYGIIGVLCVVIDYSIFYFLTKWYTLYYLIANTVSVTVGLSVSFILNSKYNFRVTDKVIQRFTIFYTVGMMGLLISSGILLFLIDNQGLDKNFSKLISIVVVVVAQFTINKYVTFRAVK